VEFRVLGSLDVSRDGTVVAISSAPKVRMVLAALLSRADQVVSLDWLIDVVWGDQAPASARQNMQHYIHRLRAALGKELIVSRPGGYVVTAEDALDATRFRRLAAQAIAALKDGRVPRAADQFRAALDLWRGPAYAEFTDSPPIADEAARLEELRITALEGWAEARLRLGRHSGLVEELTDLVREHPYRESLQGYLMRALYAAGRQADALQVFRTTRKVLAEELGVEPGPQLQRLHEQMLRGDGEPSPDGTQDPPDNSAGARGDVVRAPVPHELPSDVPGFTGRADELKFLDEMVPSTVEHTAGTVVVSAITGTAGVGKTALALHWGHRVADLFPDGQLYLNLRGYSPGRPLRPIEALTALLGALGITPRQVPVEVGAAAARYRSHLAGRRMLIVLDNARSSAQVRPLLPASAGCLVLVTSRDRLTGLMAYDGARRLTLDVLAPDESLDLFTHLLGRERVRAEPEAVTALAMRCAHLPLALRIAAASLADQPHWTVDRYVAEFSAGDPVAALALDDDLAVRSAFDLSYRTLPQPAQLVFRRLGLVPCPDYTVPAAAALADSTEPDARHALDALAAAHLVDQHAAGRYTMHDLLRQYAADLAATEETVAERDAAIRRFYDWLVAMSAAASTLLFPDALRLPPPTRVTTGVPTLTAGTAMEWLEAERHNLGAAILHAARHGPRDAAWRCADATRKYHALRVHLADWLSSARAGLAAARSDGDITAQAAAYHGLAHVRFALGHYPRSIVYLHRARALAADVGWAEAETIALKNLGIVLARLGRTREAIEHLRRALHGQEAGLPGQDAGASPSVCANTIANLAAVYEECGRLHEASDLAARAWDLYRVAAAPFGEAFARSVVGEVSTLVGRLDEGAELLESALATFRALGSRHREAHCCAWLGRLHRYAGHLDAADTYARAAVSVADEIGDPDVQAIARHALGLVHDARGDHAGAIDLHRAALTIAEKVDIRHTMAEALVGLAVAHHRRGEQRSAIDYAERALTLARAASYALIEGCALTALGRAYARAGDLGRALDYAVRALANHQRTGYQVGEADTHALLATIRQELDDHLAAGHHRDTAQTLYHRIGAELPRR
jgi:DNA-binding SARP family transcriptional activator